MLHVVCCLLYGLRAMLNVVVRRSSVERCMVYVVCCMLDVAFCMSYVLCCMMYGI